MSLTEVPFYGRATLFLPVGTGGLYRQNGKLDRAFDLLRSGNSIRATARAAGMGHATVIKLNRLMRIHAEAQGLIYEPKCGCGKPSTHRGWCVYRYNQSPVRQAAMKKLHDTQRMAAPTEGNP